MIEESMATASKQRDVRMTGRFMITGLATGHAVFHWVMQSFVVVLPGIQAAFGLSAVGVGGILASRELASGIIRLPGGVVADVLRRHWGLLLAGCIFLAGLGSLAIGVSPVYPLLLAGMALVAMAHSIWHLPASASLSYHFPERRGLALAFHGVGGSVGDVAGPLATGALLAVLGWQGILSVYAVVPIFLAFLAVWAFQNIGVVKEPNDESGAQPSRAESTKRLLANPVLWGITAHNQLVNTVDPGDPTAWSAADDIRIGDATKNRVAGMVTLNNEIVIVHGSGITAYDGTPITQPASRA